MKRIGLWEANQRSSELIKLLCAGRSAILTYQGKPLAVMKPLPEPIGTDAMIRRLEFMGLVRAAAKQTALPRWTARPLKGVSLSQTLRDERNRA